MPTKVCVVKAMVFPIVMYRCESWTIRKAEHWRTDAFELWCWRRFLRVPWTAKRSNQSILKQSSPEYLWKDWCWSSNTLATWCQGPTHWKRPWCWERLKAGEGDNRGWDGWKVSPTQWTWVWARPQELMMDREAWHAAVHGVTKSQTRLSNWTKKKELMPPAASWMPLEIHAKWSQRKRNIIGYHLQMWRSDTNELIYRTETDAQTWENAFVVTRGGELGVGRGWEFETDITHCYILKW